jgi:hypothetical protein
MLLPQHGERRFTHYPACALHFAHYNFCRVHSSLRVTAAMAAGIASEIWPLSALVS